MSTADIKATYERKIRLVRARPSIARDSSASAARLADGLVCEIRSGPHVLRAQMAPSDDGILGNPTPGQLMRGALAACLVIGYRLWASLLGVELADAEVEMTCDIDARGYLAVDPDVPPRWQRIAYAVRLTSDAPEEELRRLVEHTDAHSPMFDCLDKGIVLERTIEIRRPS